MPPASQPVQPIIKHVCTLRKLGCALLVVCFFVLITTPRHSYGMAQLKQLVNKVRPNTFPDLEKMKREEAQAPEPSPSLQEAVLTETEKQILLNLQVRKQRLDERETLINQREEQLRALRDNLQRETANLTKLQEDVEASIDAKKAQDAENLRKVVKLYDGMNPVRAADKLGQLEPRLATQILVRMNPRKASKALEALSPQASQKIVQRLLNKSAKR